MAAIPTVDSCFGFPLKAGAQIFGWFCAVNGILSFLAYPTMFQYVSEISTAAVTPDMPSLSNETAVDTSETNPTEIPCKEYSKVTGLLLALGLGLRATFHHGLYTASSIFAGILRIEDTTYFTCLVIAKVHFLMFTILLQALASASVALLIGINKKRDAYIQLFLVIGSTYVAYNAIYFILLFPLSHGFVRESNVFGVYFSEAMASHYGQIIGLAFYVHFLLVIYSYDLQLRQTGQYTSYSLNNSVVTIPSL